MKKKLKSLHVRTVHILYNLCAMILTFVRLGVISFTSLRQKCHIKIKAKCHKYLVKVSQMTRVPQVEYHWTVHYCTSMCTYEYLCVRIPWDSLNQAPGAKQ